MALTKIPHKMERTTARSSIIMMPVLMGNGDSNKEISLALDIMLDTTKKHVHNVIEKLQARSRVHAAIIAAQSGIIGKPVDYRRFLTPAPHPGLQPDKSAPSTKNVRGSIIPVPVPCRIDPRDRAHIVPCGCPPNLGEKAFWNIFSSKLEVHGFIATGRPRV
jgi:DNA-binding CsgD family transcriptional regulator